MGLHLKSNRKQLQSVLQRVPVGHPQDISITDQLGTLTVEGLELLDMALQQLNWVFQIVSVQYHAVSLMRAIAVVSGELAVHA